jgi:hypothetical protein
MFCEEKGIKEVTGERNGRVTIPAAGRQAANRDGTADERMSCGAFIDVPAQESGGTKGGA